MVRSGWESVCCPHRHRHCVPAGGPRFRASRRVADSRRATGL